MFCSTCGQKSAPDERFCSECGSSLEKSGTGKKGLSPKMVKLMALGAVALVVAIVLGVVLPGNREHSSPEAVVDAFFLGLQKGNVKQSISLVDPEMLKGEDVDYIISIMSQAMIEEPIVSYRIGAVNMIDDSHAKVEVSVTVRYRGGLEETSTSIGVIKKGGKYYIASFTESPSGVGPPPDDVSDD